jgi:hypothetical protein
LYDIDIKAGALQSKKLLNDFTKFLNLPENKALWVKLEVIGKQLSNDAQSQFLLQQIMLRSLY